MKGREGVKGRRSATCFSSIIEIKSNEEKEGLTLLPTCVVHFESNIPCDRSGSCSNCEWAGLGR